MASEHVNVEVGGLDVAKSEAVNLKAVSLEIAIVSSEAMVRSVASYGHYLL